MAKRPPIPRCPGNPSDYVLVKTKRGCHWRHKRYTFTPNAKGNFLLCLRAESYEGKELANNSSSRGMMVVKAGVLK
jgi:hypothetical protein